MFKNIIKIYYKEEKKTRVVWVIAIGKTWGDEPQGRDVEVESNVAQHYAHQEFFWAADQAGMIVCSISSLVSNLLGIIWSVSLALGRIQWAFPL